jgi:acetyl-CoA synthetase
MAVRINSFEQYKEDYKLSVENPEAFWAGVADTFTWKKKWDKVLEWNFTEPKVEWFKGAQLNITENCLDRHLATKGDAIAYVWESNDVNEANRTLTYKQLHEEVCKFANVLKSNGVKKGDRVCMYMPMVPELAIVLERYIQ